MEAFLSPANRLLKPTRITEQRWPEDTVPVVSVFSWSFNHTRFIRESIDSILMQETTFPVEIIIHDDASQDGTAEIIREYECKHPRLFRNILQTENQWSQGKSVMVPMVTAPRGEFIALTHGDDYWTTPHKLEQQVTALLKNPDIHLSFHAHKEVDESGIDRVPRDPRTPATGILQRGAFFRHECEPFQTASFVVRRQFTCDLPAWFNTLPFGDVSMFALASIRGPLYSLPGSHSCYRLHESGVVGNCWTEQDRLVKTRKTIFWNDSFARLFELLVDETDDVNIARQCRAYALDYLQDVIWSCRLLGDRKGMRLAICKSLRVAPWSAVKTWRMWKDALIAFTPLPDFSMHRHLTKASHGKMKEA